MSNYNWREITVEHYCCIGEASYKDYSCCLCWRHTVPKLTPDGHTNVEICISREVGPELGQKPKTSTMPEKLHRRLYDGLRCTHELPDVFTIRAESENFLHRVSIFAQLRDSVTPALQTS